MTVDFAEQYQTLMGAVDTRRRHLPYRLAIAVVIGFCLQNLLGWDWIWIWAGFYAAAQSAEAWVLRPSAREQWAEPSTFRMLAVATNFIVQAAIFACLSAPIWREGGPYGPVIATLILVGAVFNLIVISRGSKLAFFAGATPYLAFGVYNLAADSGVAAELRVLMGIAAGLVAVNCFSAWKIGEQAAAKERASLLEAERARAQAQAETAAKSSLVAMVSHELRTPISAILAGAAAMERAAVDVQSRSNAALIVDASRMMRAMLDDLLDLSKLEAGRMTIETIAFDLRALVKDAVRFWAAEARKKGLRLRLTGSASLPRHVKGDPTRLRQILNNLFSNALKFTDEGSVTLELAARANSVAFTVRDTGRGLTDEQIARLFTPFDQSDASVARTHGGTGLGLSISRELARAMNGELTVDPNLKRGAAFTLRVPLPAAAPAAAPLAAPIEQQAAAPQPDKALRILAVDDHEFNRRAIALVLEPLGVDLSLADNAATALEMLARSPFDVVLMDVNMPEMGGREATRLLRQKAGPNQGTPVIAVTGSASEEDLASCLAAGMTSRVVKPIEVNELYAALERATSAQPGQNLSAA